MRFGRVFSSGRVLSPSTDFFGRKRELELFGQVLAKPQFSVVVGGTNVGKTASLKQALAEGSHKVAHFNLRRIGLDCPMELHLHLHKQFRLLSHIPELPSRVEDYQVGQLATILDGIARYLPEWKTYDKENNANNVLLIDNADGLKRLIRTHGDVGDAAVRTLLNWIISITKEEKRLSVVMVSSDNSFLEWLQYRNVLNFAKVYTVGDLCFDEAALFYEMMKKSVLTEPQRELAPPFDEVYDILGGKLTHIASFLEDFAIEKGKMTWDSFAPLQASVERIHSVLYPKYFQPGLEKPLWTREQLFRLMKIELVPNSFVTYSRARFLLDNDEAAIKSLLRYGVLIYRPNKKFNFDLPSAPDSTIPLDIIELKPVDLFTDSHDPQLNFLRPQALRSTFCGRWKVQTHRIPPWRSTSVGRWKERTRWILRSRQSTFSQEGQQP
jgi:hypothetical protein